jgi:hypothetical protein
MSMRSSSPTSSVHVRTHTRGRFGGRIRVAEHDRSPPATVEAGAGARSYLHPANVAKAQAQVRNALTYFKQNAARDRAQGVDGGWQLAADHLAHFLEGTGTPVVLSSEQINRMPAVLEAEENSRRNFAKTFVEDTGNPTLNASVKGLKAGASLELDDF